MEHFRMHGMLGTHQFSATQHAFIGIRSQLNQSRGLQYFFWLVLAWLVDIVRHTGSRWNSGFELFTRNIWSQNTKWRKKEPLLGKKSFKIRSVGGLFPEEKGRWHCIKTQKTYLNKTNTKALKKSEKFEVLVTIFSGWKHSGSRQTLTKIWGKKVKESHHLLSWAPLSEILARVYTKYSVTRSAAADTLKARSFVQMSGSLGIDSVLPGSHWSMWKSRGFLPLCCRSFRFRCRYPPEWAPRSWPQLNSYQIRQTTRVGSLHQVQLSWSSDFCVKYSCLHWVQKWSSQVVLFWSQRWNAGHGQRLPSDVKGVKWKTSSIFGTWPLKFVLLCTKTGLDPFPNCKQRKQRDGHWSCGWSHADRSLTGQQCARMLASLFIFCWAPTKQHICLHVFWEVEGTCGVVLFFLGLSLHASSARGVSTGDVNPLQQRQELSVQRKSLGTHFRLLFCRYCIEQCECGGAHPSRRPLTGAREPAPAASAPAAPQVSSKE